MLNATRGDDLHMEVKQEIIRLATTGGIESLLCNEPQALAGSDAATVMAELPTCLFLNEPAICLEL
jgi:hypothetical protein